MYIYWWYKVFLSLYINYSKNNALYIKRYYTYSNFTPRIKFRPPIQIPCSSLLINIYEGKLIILLGLYMAWKITCFIHTFFPNFRIIARFSRPIYAMKRLMNVHSNMIIQHPSSPFLGMDRTVAVPYKQKEKFPQKKNTKENTIHQSKIRKKWKNAAPTCPVDPSTSTHPVINGNPGRRVST